MRYTLGERLGLAWDGATLAAIRLHRAAAPLAAALAAQAGRTGRHPLLWGTLYLAVFCPLSMAVFDQPVALWFKTHLSGDWEGFFKIVTNLGLAEYSLVPSGLLTLGLVLAARRALLPRTRARLIAWAWRPGYLFLAVASSGIVENVIKVILGRARPRLLFDQDIYGFFPFSHGWALNSFPSGHSQAIWAAMTALAVLAPRHRPWWLGLAALVAFSRVATTVHYLSDAVTGSWLGFAAALILARVLRGRGITL